MGDDGGIHWSPYELGELKHDIYIAFFTMTMSVKLWTMSIANQRLTISIYFRSS